MQVKLTQPGYENFTGTFGNHVFEDGVSEHVTTDMVAMISAIVSCEPVKESEVLQGSENDVQTNDAKANEGHSVETISGSGEQAEQTNGAGQDHTHDAIAGVLSAEHQA